MDPILDPLNEPQRRAVLHGDGPMLVLAGAGSGKTRVIVHRVAHLVRDRGVAPWHVLCVTFTNKAAGEMKGRLVELLGAEAEQAWVSTFHAFGARFLRREAQAAGLSPSFPIYDDGDQMSLVKRLLSEGKVDTLGPREVLSRIDRWKNAGLSPGKVHPADQDHDGQAALGVWRAYERALQRAGAVDFGDLLLKPLDLLELDEGLRRRWSTRFRYVLVDEFQDTSPAQYRLVRILAGERRNVCVVGDDDQAIYRWRGADVGNILDFDQVFPGTEVVKLEQNYRSSRYILDAAHAVIEKARRRREKRLWTEREGGAPLQLLVSDDEHQEGERLARAVQAVHGGGVAWEEIAVLYRINAQSRAVESALRAARVPYVIVRGQSFYERAEVKDAAAYLRLALEPRSDLDLLRVVNRPSRKIGDRTVALLRDRAAAAGQSLFEALAGLEEAGELKPQARRALASFRDLVAGLHARVADLSAAEAVQAVLEETQLIDKLRLEGTDEAVERAENLLELLAAAREFDDARREAPPPADPEEPVTPPLSRFLEQIALLGEADAPTPEGRVALMTLHAAKGLEFDAVFLAGMEEGTLPHERPWRDDSPAERAASLDEERRLCYVGMTRARHRLTLSLARRRMSYGESGPTFRSTEPSRFLGDLPPELFGLPARGAAPAPPPVARGPVIRRHPGALADEPHIELEEEPAGAGPVERSIDYSFDQTVTGPAEAFARGARVRHTSFGEGLVRGSDGAGGDAKVTVAFFSVGEKRVLARFLRPA